MDSPMKEAYVQLIEVIAKDTIDPAATELHVRQLIASLPSVLRARDDDERTALHHAARLGRTSLLVAILEANPDSDVDVRDVDRCTPLHLAARNGHEGCVATLVCEAGADVRAEESFLETPLHEASRGGYARIVTLLIENGAVVDAPNRDLGTSLHIAARRGNEDVIRVLLEAGANPGTRDAVGDTPLHDAARGGHEGVVMMLLGTGSVSIEAQNANDFTPLSVAARHGREAIVRMLVEQGADVDTMSNEYCTPLHQAASEGHDGVVRILIAAGADVDLQDKDDQTPLHAGVMFEHEAVVASLLAADADVDVRDTEDCTPLHHAVKNENKRLVRDLLEAGADPTVISSMGETPQSLAKLLNRNSIADLFNSPQVVPKQNVGLDVFGVFAVAGVGMGGMSGGGGRVKKTRPPSRPNQEAEIEAYGGQVVSEAASASDDTADAGGVAGAVSTVCRDGGPEPRRITYAQPRAIKGAFESAESRGESEAIAPSNAVSLAAAFSSPSAAWEPCQQRRKSSHTTGGGGGGGGTTRATSSIHKDDQRPIKRWFHLPTNNVAWVMDLVQRICAVDGRPDAECNRMIAFIEETFQEIRISAPYRKPHFRMEAATAAAAAGAATDGSGGTGMPEVSLGSEVPAGPVAAAAAAAPPPRSQMFSLVLPVIDVDIDEGTKRSLQDVHIGDEAKVFRPMEMVGGGAVAVPAAAAGNDRRAPPVQRPHPLSAMPTNLQHYLFPHLAHFDAMAKMRATFTKSELHVPRSLDQSYHESLSASDLALRNESQVLFRYLRRVEGRLAASAASAAGTTTTGTTAAGSSTAGDTIAEDVLGKQPLTEDGIASTRVHQQQQKTEQHQQNPFDRHAQRAYSRQSSSKQKKTDGTKAELGRMAGRQDQASSVQAKISREKRRMDTERRKQILVVAQLWIWRIDEHTIITAFPDRWDNKNAKTLLNQIKHRVLGTRDMRSENTDMMRVVESILESAVEYSEEEFHFQFEGPRSYCNIFAASIAHVSNEAMKRYANFKASISKMGTSKTVLDDLRAEIELLQEIDDVREEINMIKRVLRSQERVFDGFREAEAEQVGSLCGGVGVGEKQSGGVVKPYKHPTLDFFKRLEEDANRVRDSVSSRFRDEVLGPWLT
ncbi:hypothetical protein CFIO01_05338 [Colletotrichum fioriniae PJ7]|uniref:Uncharacterized protein n=1 Tax=Colletotrichum fioriniae PJ7 TaxID=1445577 RepID=A0A010Q7B1_9PEZI|nr:hypothetical protein CFIO01_05338 [Colletotrichum fioriniae PJ7]